MANIKEGVRAFSKDLLKTYEENKDIVNFFELISKIEIRYKNIKTIENNLNEIIENETFLNKKKDSRVLPEDFKLPDFNLSKENRVMPEERFKINHNGQKWNCILNLERCDTNDEDNLFGKEGDVVLKIYDSENEEEVAGFTAVVIKNINHERGGSPELNNVNFLSITSRMIRSDYRREKTGKKSFLKGIR